MQRPRIIGMGAGSEAPEVLVVDAIDNGYIATYMEAVRIEDGAELAKEKATIDAAAELAQGAGVPTETIHGAAKLIRGAFGRQSNGEGPQYRLVKHEQFCPTIEAVQAMMPQAAAAHARLLEARAEGGAFTHGDYLAC